MSNLLASYKVTRRQFGQLSAALVAGIAGIVRVRTSHAATLEFSALPGAVMYVFDPQASRQSNEGIASCASCSACRGHAENKRFASYEAADRRRAHANCRCAIRAEPVSPKHFAEMFGGSRGVERRDQYDVRWEVRA